MERVCEGQTSLTAKDAVPEGVRSGAPAELKGQKAIVTGASSGIGKAIALALGRAGVDVAVNYRGNGRAHAEAVVEEIEAVGPRAFAWEADVRREDQVQSMFRREVEEFGALDLLVCSAGVQRDAPFDRLTLEDWHTVLETNLTGQFLCAREAVRQFKRQEIRPGISRAAGKIICISSVHERIRWAGHVNYAASKAGVLQMVKSIAQEVAPSGIRVNCIAPGAVRTPINREAWGTPDAYRELTARIPAGRIGEPDEIGQAVVWLASDAADYVQGTSLTIDGGMNLYPAFSDGG